LILEGVNQLDEDNLCSITEFDNIEKLTLEGASNIESFNWDVFFVEAKLKNLTQLCLRACTKFSTKNVGMIASCCKNLEKLDLSYCYSI